MIKEQIPIIPGSMLSDISPNEMGEHEHLEVVNLRRNRIGEWESVPGYVTILENSGYSGITTAIEVTDDLAESGDSDAVSGYGWKRFILYHDNTGQIRRVMYTASGYDIGTDELVAQSGTISGVDVPASGVRLFYHNGIVRITGTTEPLWYGRIKRYWLNTHNLKKWYLEKAELSNSGYFSGYVVQSDLSVYDYYKTLTFSGDSGGFTKKSGVYPDRTQTEIEAMYSEESVYWYFKVALIYDDGQVSLMNLINPNQVALYHERDQLYKYSAACISINYPEAGADNRLTGAALCVGKSAVAANDDNETVVYKVVDFLDLVVDAEKNQQKYFELTTDGLITDTESPSYNVCTFSASGTTQITAFIPLSRFYTSVGNCYFLTEYTTMRAKFIEMMKLARFGESGIACTVYDNAGSEVNTTISSITFEKIDVFKWDVYYHRGIRIRINFGSAINSITSFRTLAIKRLAINRSSTIDFCFGFDNMDWDGYDYHEYADIPAGTDNISPNYSHHIVIGDRAYVTSLENEEEDFVRYSAQNKYDVFPDTNLISTGAGDLDRNMVIVARDDKFMILKRNSITQGQMTGETYFQDTAFTRHGLYPLKGYIVLDHILYVMEKDDIYAFAGTEPEPLMGLTKIREFYRANVDTNSFFAFDNQNNELWVILNGHVLVWNRNYNDWYIRLDDFSFTGYFNDSETRLIGYGVSGGAKSTFAAFNHDSAWFSENINWSFRTKFQDNQHPELYKKLDEILVWQKGNVGTSYSGYDNQTNDVFAGSFPPSPSGYSGQLASPFFPYHELVMVFSGTSGYSGMEFSMKKSRLNIGRWGNGI